MEVMVDIIFIDGVEGRTDISWMDFTFGCWYIVYNFIYGEVNGWIVGSWFNGWIDGSWIFGRMVGR